MGKTGSGKTHLMEVLAQQLMQAGEPFVFFDFHGDASQHLLGLAANHPDAARRLVLVDPTDALASPGLNPLEAERDETMALARTSELSSILRQRWNVEAFGPRTEELLRNVLFLLAAGGYTLVEAPLVLSSDAFRGHLLSKITHPDVLDYWQGRYDSLSERMKVVFREPLLNKITGFLTEPATRHFLGQQASTFTFAKAAGAGQWVLINLAKGRLREHAHTLGNLVFARLQFEIMARAQTPESSRRLLTVFCDEAANFAENDITDLLAEGRKFQASLVVGHQFEDQLPRELRGALLACGTRVFFQLSAADAGSLAAELSVTARHRYHKELTELRRGHALVRTGAQTAVHIRVPNLPKAAVPAEVHVLRSLSVRQVARARVDIEQEIRGRRDAFSPHSPLQLTNINDDASEGQKTW
jgi:hypothetical protein